MLLDSFRTQTSCVHIISFFMRTPNLFIYLSIFLRSKPENVLTCSHVKVVWFSISIDQFGRELLVLLDHSFTFLLPLSILLTKKKKEKKTEISKIKTFLTDSQPGYVLSMLLKFSLISA